MAERWVVNASPLIVLSKINHQHLLAQLADELLVPNAVLAEIEAGPPQDPARLFLAHRPLPSAAVSIEPSVLKWDLGAGESAVLSYALQNPGWRAVVDDGLARRCARTLNVPLIGTLGIVLRARHLELISAAVPVLKALQSVGLRLDEQLLKTALPASVKEIWE